MLKSPVITMSAIVVLHTLSTLSSFFDHFKIVLSAVRGSIEPANQYPFGFYLNLNLKRIEKVREKSRECQNHKPHPFPDTKRKRKQTKPNKRISNKKYYD